MDHGSMQHHIGDEQCLYAAIKQCQEIEPVKNLVERGADISKLCGNYWTPLTLAAHLGKTDVIKYLLDCIRQDQEKSTTQYHWRPSVDSVNEAGQTALFCAAQQGHTEVCQVLLSEGADVNAQSQNSKRTALMAAILFERKDTVETLLDWLADVQLSDNVGITPLYAAVDKNRGDLVQLLIKAGCDVNIGSQDHCPLFLAARRNYPDIVEILCDAGCSKNIRNKYGVTPLYEAALRGHNSILQFLIEGGSELHQCDLYDNSPLQAATINGNVKGVEMLLKAGALLKWRNIQGRCAVQIAIEWNKPHVLEFYLSYGVDVTKKPTVSLPNIGNKSSLEVVFERAQYAKILVVLLRGCTQLGPFTTHAPLNSLDICRNHPIVLELFFAGGLSHPPYKLLEYPSIRDSSWLADFKATPRSLKSWARSSVRASLGNTILHDAPKLPLPVSLINYVMFTEAVLEPS